MGWARSGLAGTFMLVLATTAMGCGARLDNGTAGAAPASGVAASGVAACGEPPTNPTSTTLPDRPWCGTTTATARPGQTPTNPPPTGPGGSGEVPVRVVSAEEHVQVGDHLLSPGARSPLLTIGEVLDRLATGPYPFGDVGDRRHLTVRLGLYRFDGNPALTDVLVYVIEGIATGCASHGAPPGPGRTSPPVVEASCETTSIANADTGQSLLVIQRGIGTSSQDAPPSGFPNMPTVVPPPDLGDFETADALIHALRGSGPLSNESAAAQAAGTAPSRSICVDIVEGREPTVGAMIHEAIASLGGDGGVLVVFERADGTRQARLYSTGAADATGGCRLIMAAPLP